MHEMAWVLLMIARQHPGRFLKIAHSQVGQPPISEKHPGCGSAVPIALRNGRVRLRKVEGGAPTRRANSKLKVPRLENPTAAQISVTLESLPARSWRALARRAAMRTWWGVSPKQALNIRMNW